MQTDEWKRDYEEFERVTRQFYEGEITIPEYKSFSGGYGSYAQRGGKASMLRLKFPGGRVRKAQLAFIAESIDKYRKIGRASCRERVYRLV